MKNKFSALVFAIGFVPALAMAEAPAKPLAPAPQPQAMQIVTGPPVKAPEVAKDDEAKLKYWDGTKPLTIGEMSEMQRKKLTEEFLAKHGYTTKEPQKPAVQAKTKLPPPPPHSLKVQAVYGPQSSPTVDFMLNGKFVTLKTGTKIRSGTLMFGVKRAERGKGVVLDIPPRIPEACKRETKKGKCKQLPAVSTSIRGGDTMEFPR